MKAVRFVLFLAGSAFALDILSVQKKLEIVDFLSRDYFGSRIVTFLKLGSEGKNLV